MIQSFADKHTEAFYNGESVRKFRGFAVQAERRMNVQDAATTLEDLAVLPSNRLESLSGDRKGQHPPLLPHWTCQPIELPLCLMVIELSLRILHSGCRATWEHLLSSG